MAYVASATESHPLGDMNMTPLIDVMLVLLIMFIITIPMQTHAVKLDIPPPGPLPLNPDPVKNKIVVTGTDQILWNGQPIDRSGLQHLLLASQQMRPTPEIHLQPEPDARYALVDEVLATTKRAEVEKMGFVGNEQYLDAF